MWSYLLQNNAKIILIADFHFIYSEMQEWQKHIVQHDPLQGMFWYSWIRNIDSAMPVNLQQQAQQLKILASPLATYQTYAQIDL